MNNTLHVTVTQAHIDHGTRGSRAECPLALAVTEALGPARADCLIEVTADQFTVGTTTAWAVCGNVSYPADLPPEAHQFRRMFDRGDDVTPLEFDLTWPVLP